MFYVRTRRLARFQLVVNVYLLFSLAVQYIESRHSYAVSGISHTTTLVTRKLLYVMLCLYFFFLKCNSAQKFFFYLGSFLVVLPFLHAHRNTVVHRHSDVYIRVYTRSIHSRQGSFP